MVTGDFDLVLQISQDAIRRVLTAMHVKGIWYHHYAGYADGRLVEIGLGAPTIALDPMPGADGKPRATATSHAIYRSRSPLDPADPGTNTTATVAFRADVWATPGGDPVPLGETSRLVVDASATRAEDIDVHAGSEAVRAEAKAAILDLITTESARAFAIPSVTFDGDVIGSGVLVFGDATTPVVTLGMNVGTAIKGSRSQLGPPFTTLDFGLAISRSLVDRTMEEELERQLGALPPPRGSDTVVLREREICVVDSPLGCVTEATERVRLDRLDWQFEEGQITFTGHFTRSVTSVLVPDASADFTVHATAGLDAGGVLTLALDQPEVTIDQWWLEFADLLTGGRLRDAVRDAIADVLQNVGGVGSVGGILSTDTLTRFASIASLTSARVSMSATPTAVAIHADGLLLEGSLGVAPSTGPMAGALDAVPSSTDPASITFDAGAFWSPGGAIAGYSWDFGDGTSEDYAGDGARMAVRHVYAPGTYQACVTVTDTQGRQATRCREVTPGALVLERSALGNDAFEMDWAICDADGTGDLALTFKVTTTQAPVAGATVTLGSGTPRRAEWTNDAGLAVFSSVPRALFAPSDSETGFPRTVSVTATKDGFTAVTQTLRIVDCAAAGRWRDYYRELAGRIRLLPMRVLEPLGPRPTDFDGGDPWDPYAAIARDTAHATLALQYLIALAEHTTDDILLAHVLAASDTGTRSSDRMTMAERLQRTVDLVGARLIERSTILQRTKR